MALVLKIQDMDKEALANLEFHLADAAYAITNEHEWLNYHTELEEENDLIIIE